MKRVLFNKKGGVGKSSLAVNLAAIAAAQGERVLIVDLDTQCNSSAYLGLESASDDRDIAGLFEQTITFHLHRQPPSYFCQPTQWDNLSLLAGSGRLASLATELESRHKIYKLREALQELESDFDHIFLDTPPALNFFSLSALIAADSCLIPIDCDDFARRGLYELNQQIQEIREDHNEVLQVEGIIANQYLARANLPQRIISELVEEGYPVLPEPIRQSVKMRESHEAKTPLIHMAPKHPLTESLLTLYGQLHKG